jgi:copper chaperone CopZ
MSSYTKATLTIDDMACSGCAETVQDALTAIDSVEEAHVDHENNTASVIYDSDAVSSDYFEAAVDEAGYTLKDINFSV